MEKVDAFLPKTLTLQDAVAEAGRCLLCEDAPCSRGCPAGTDPGRFIRQIRFENYKGAARTIKGNNIFGAVCAFTCPVEKLCEKECCRRLLNAPVDIGGLQRFACEYGKKAGIEKFEKGSASKGDIAVIGAGPAGMSCAAELAKKGYNVTIYEKEGETGGVAAHGIPSFRLPHDALEYATSCLKELGVRILTGSKVDGKGGAKEMLLNGYKAVFISTGLSDAMRLSIFDGYDNVETAAGFLRGVKERETGYELSGKSVAVIGGGSVAMDAAVSARHLGAGRVYAVSLEAMDELPATRDEIALARKANVIFRPSSQITGVAADGRKIIGLRGTEIRWKEPGNFSPANAAAIQGTEFNMSVHYVIQAIGSKAGAELQEVANGADFGARGVIRVRDDLSTFVPGVFAGGDIVNGGGTIADAVGHGKKAAAGIDGYLAGR